MTNIRKSAGLVSLLLRDYVECSGAAPVGGKRLTVKPTELKSLLIQMLQTVNSEGHHFEKNHRVGS